MELSYIVSKKLFLYLQKWNFAALYFSFISGSNFLNSKNENNLLWKNEYFWDMKLSSPKLKKSWFFFLEPLRVFHHCFFMGFHFSPLIFTTAFGCFHCKLYCSCYQLSLLWLLFCRFFVRYLVFCVFVPRLLRIWERFLYSQTFSILHSFLNLPQYHE